MYAKVFAQIYDSSLAEDWRIRLVFMDLLVLADSEGYVDMTHQAIARRTNVPERIIRAAIEKLMQPDPESRTDSHEGRRLLPLDAHRSWGWKIVNFEKYRNMRDEDGRRAYMRELMRRKRQEEKASKTGAVSSPLADVSSRKPALAQAEAKAEAEAAPPTPSLSARLSDAYQQAWPGRDGRALLQWLRDGHPEWAILAALSRAVEKRARQPDSYIGGVLRGEAPGGYEGLKPQAAGGPRETRRDEVIRRTMERAAEVLGEGEGRS